MVGDHTLYLSVDLIGFSAPQGVREAMSVLMDQYRVPLWHVGAGDAPAYRMLPDQGYKGYFELVALRAESLTRDPRTHKEPAAPAQVLVRREDVAVVQRYFP